MSLQLTIACGDYDRTHPLIDGSIKPEGLELNWLVLPHLEIWTRMLNYYDFDVSEISLSSYLIARTIGKRLTAIPVFPARAFRHSYVFIKKEGSQRQKRGGGGTRGRWGEMKKAGDGWGGGSAAQRRGVQVKNFGLTPGPPPPRKEEDPAEPQKIYPHPTGSAAGQDVF